MKIWIPFSFAVAALSLVSCDKLKTVMVTKLEEQANLAPIPKYDGPLVSQIGAETFDDFIAEKDRLIVIDFYADWCGPCRRLSPVLEAIANDHNSRILVGKIDTQKHPEFSQEQGVSGIPDVRIYRNGELIDGFKGFGSEAAVRQQLEAHLVNVPPIQKQTLPEDLPGPKQEIGQPAEDPTKPASKDWLPPGVERR